MNRRSFFHRALSAIVAARMARELSASPIEREEEFAPPTVEEWSEPIAECPNCTYENMPLIGTTGVTRGFARCRLRFCAGCQLEIDQRYSLELRRNVLGHD